jgi:hypothetical protein
MSRVVFNGKKFNKSLDDIVNQITKKLTQSIFEDIKERSPVAKKNGGRFKRSWTMRGKDKKYTISNPQPYGPALEKGRSRQAPNGVVRPAINNIRTKI